METMTIDHPNKITRTGYDHPDPQVGKIANLDTVRGGDGGIYSAWKPSWRELWQLARGASIWIGILSQRQPPITVVIGHNTKEVVPPVKDN